MKELLECREPVARAMLAVAQRYAKELTEGFPSAEPLVDNATELLCAA